jgi:hypothetical protein
MVILCVILSRHPRQTDYPMRIVTLPARAKRRGARAASRRTSPHNVQTFLLLYSSLPNVQTFKLSNLQTFPLFSTTSALFFATAPLYPFSFLPITHSFDRNGGVPLCPSKKVKKTEEQHESTDC